MRVKQIFKINISLLLILSFLLLLLPTRSVRLRYMFEMSRHGSRKPCFPIYPDSLDGHINCELTPGGQRQHFLIGQSLRQIYIEQSKFLSQYYNPRQIQVFSTPVNRTILSAQAQLMGLYPQTKYQLNEKQKKFGVPPLKSMVERGQQFQTPSPTNQQAIPVFVDNNQSKEYLLDIMPNCPYVIEFISFQKTPPEFLEKFKQKGKMGPFDILIKKFNLTEQELTPQVVWNYIDDIAMTMEQYPQINKYSLSRGEMNTLMHFFKFIFFEGKFKDEKQNALLNTNIFKYLINNFKLTIKNDKSIAELERSCKFHEKFCDKARLAEENRLKFSYFSQHDSNIISMVQFLKYFEPPESPSGAATFFFRLYSKQDNLGDDDDYYVEIEYNGYVVRTLAFNQFKSDIADKMYEGSIEEGCQVKDEQEMSLVSTVRINYNNNEDNVKETKLINLIIFLLSLLLGVSVMYWWSNRKEFVEEEEDQNGYVLLDTENI